MRVKREIKIRKGKREIEKKRGGGGRRHRREESKIVEGNEEKGE